MKKLLALALVLPLCMVGCSKVSTGYVGVESVLGTIKQDELNPGLYQTITRDVLPVSIRETTISLDNLHPKTANNVTMKTVDIDVRYIIQPNKVAETVSALAGDVTENANGDVNVGERFIKRFALEAVFKTVSKFPADTIHTKREEIAADITNELQSSLNKAMPHTFTIAGVTVRQMITDPKLEAAITRAAQTQFETARATEQKALAEAQALVKITQAKAEADANRIVASSLTPMLIKKMEIESQSKFAGKGTHTVIMDGNSKPLINVR